MYFDLTRHATPGTNYPIPWRWYHPDVQDRIRFRQTDLGDIELTKIPGLTQPGDYVLASKIGQHIDGGNEIEWDNRKTKLDIQLMLEKMGCDSIDETALAIYRKDDINWFCQHFLRTRFEYAHLYGMHLKEKKEKGDGWWVLAGLRRFEKLMEGLVPFYAVHHIFPQQQFPDMKARIENLILLPKTIHEGLHAVYKMIDNHMHPANAVDSWLWNSRTPPLERCRWKSIMDTCAICYAEAIAVREPKWEFIK